MRRRHSRTGFAAMGDGISFEEVLTVITVLLLLRVVFLVPVVSLDRIKTETAESDRYWSQQATHVLGNATEDEESILPYRAAFAIRDMHAMVTTRGDHIWVEAATPDSGSLLILKHAPENGNFVALSVQDGGFVRTFRRGILLWSERESEWFIGNDTVDYGTHSSSLDLEQEFREWTRRERGY